MLQDLVDIPGMIHEAGKLFIKARRGRLTGRDVGSTHLGAQFGWIPLVNDITKVIQVHKHIQDRVRELDRLYSTSGLKRRIRLGTWGASSVSAPVMESYPILSISTILSTQTVSERWGTVRWRPTGTFLGYRPESHVILQQAKDALSGVTTEGTFEGAWDLLPWSWLADWGTNVKDFVMAHANTIPATPSSINVMTRTVTTFRPRVLSITPSYSWEPGFYTITSKERYVGSGAIGAQIPFVDLGRLSILSALVAQRYKR